MEKKKTPNLNKLNEASKKEVIEKLEIKLAESRATFTKLLEAGSFVGQKYVDVTLDVDDLVSDLTFNIVDESITAEKLFEMYKQKLQQIAKAGKRDDDPSYNN